MAPSTVVMLSPVLATAASSSTPSLGLSRTGNSCTQVFSRSDNDWNSSNNNSNNSINSNNSNNSSRSNNSNSNDNISSKNNSRSNSYSQTSSNSSCRINIVGSLPGRRIELARVLRGSQFESWILCSRCLP